jgi:replicative DNA helicase
MKLFNLDIERAILNSIIQDNDKFKDKILTEKDFYHPFHQIVFKTMKELLEQKDFIDEFILKEELEKKGKFDETEFFEILSTTPIENVEEYAKIVKELALKRELTLLLKNNNTIIQQKDPIEVINELKNSLEQLEEQNSFNYFAFDDFNTAENKKDISFILKDFLPIPKGCVTLLNAKGGSGKTFLAIQLILRYLNTETGKAFAWLSEDKVKTIKKRAELIINRILINDNNNLKTDINNPLYVNNFKYAGSDSNLKTFPFIEFTYKGEKINTLFYKLKKALEDFDFIVIDPLLNFFGGNENDNYHARRFMNLLNEWASDKDKAILIIHHNNKNMLESKIRGASAFTDTARVQYSLNKRKKDKNETETDYDDGIRIIKVEKDNVGVRKYLKSNEKEIKIFDFDNEFSIKKETNKQNKQLGKKNNNLLEGLKK